MVEPLPNQAAETGLMSLRDEVGNMTAVLAAGAIGAIADWEQQGIPEVCRS